MPKFRSVSIIVRPAESAGSASRSSHAYVKIVHTKSGIRVQVIPRARMFEIVTMKLIAPASDERVSTCSDRIHRSCPRPGECRVESVAYEVQPAEAAPPLASKLRTRIRPPRRYSQ